MALQCSHCGRTLDFSGDAPSFCAYCGRPLTAAALHPDAARPGERTQSYVAATSEEEHDPERTYPAETQFRAPAELEPTEIGPYRILRRIGRGGMGTVYEAEDSRTQRRVALKLIARSYADNQDAAARFRQEGHLAGRIDHPRCVFVYEADEFQGRPYIVMELMTGLTLSDYVRKHGPLSPEDAVTRILDVIDGLREAHRLGLIHRDVKPGNCFLDDEGRVKIGDFGLSKSISGELKTGTGSDPNRAALTRTGAFLGTPLYAAPEQVKGDGVGQQADVYAVTATLHFLLTGRAPFESDADAMATLARIASEDPLPPRNLNPEISRGLERVLLRGLARDRKRRYRNLDALRLALQPFLPRRVAIVGLGLRLGAYFLDAYVVLAVLNSIALVGAFFIARALYTDVGSWDDEIIYLSANLPVLTHLLSCLATVLYFAVPEKLFGCSFGKWLLGLRVYQADRARPPRWGQALGRTLAYFWLINLLAFLGDLVLPREPFDPRVPIEKQSDLVRESLEFHTFLLPLISLGVGYALMASTMRRHNGYRGLHEWMSGTRTVRTPIAHRTTGLDVAKQADPLEVFEPQGLPAAIGPYQVRGAVVWQPEHQIIVAEDGRIHRAVWIWRRPESEPDLSATRHQVDRPTRWRWLAEAVDGAMRWDAFLAVPGQPFVRVVEKMGAAPWSEARRVVDALVRELAAGRGDGTLPPRISLAHLWFRDDGGVQVLDMPIASAALRLPQFDPREDWGPFLYQVCQAVLEGRLPSELTPVPIQAAIPVHARKLMDRLAGFAPSYLDLAEFQVDLAATEDAVTEVSGFRRLALLMLQGFGTVLLVATPSIGLDALARFTDLGKAVDRTTLVNLQPFVWLLVPSLWAAATRGGLSYRLVGLALRRKDGTSAGRWRCAVRTFVVLAPIVLTFLPTVLIDRPRVPASSGAGLSPTTVRFTLEIVQAAAIVLSMVVIARRPHRAWHDALVDTVVVPR